MKMWHFKFQKTRQTVNMKLLISELTESIRDHELPYFLILELFQTVSKFKTSAKN